MSTEFSNTSCPVMRLTTANRQSPNPRGRFVLYWMTTNRRTTWNFAFDHAIQWAGRLQKPLLIVETLVSGRRWDTDRHHAFVLQGMVDNADACQKSGVRYYPFVERWRGESTDLITALSANACLIIADDYPIKRFTAEAQKVANKAAVLFECVDANGLLPLRVADKIFTTAYAFRRFLQRVLPDYLPDYPQPNPLRRVTLPRFRGIPREITNRWPPASPSLIAAEPAAMAKLPIDHSVGIVTTRGGQKAARKRLNEFLARKLANYVETRNHPGIDGTSGLSPYLHFGHISVHEIFHKLAKRENWSPDKLSETATGRREGWWGLSPSAEAFCDELVTWREIGFNMCSLADNYDEFDSLPDWAQETLCLHSADAREYVYTLDQLQRADTHDLLWNAAQRQLRVEGVIHNYMRMLWGKKILQWSKKPNDALAAMIELNNLYALDGQDPNSYSGIFWVLGRYDRPWGPERKVFGKIRYMSSRNTVRKLNMGNYLDKFEC